MQIVVLASPDEVVHISPRVEGTSSIHKLKSLWSNQFSVSPEELLIRNESGSALADDTTVQELSSDKATRVIYLSVEVSVGIALRLYDSLITEENGPHSHLQNGFEGSNDHYENDKSVSCGDTKTISIWLSMNPSEVVEAIRSTLNLHQSRPLRLLMGRESLDMEQSFGAQGVRDGTLVEVEEVLRDVEAQTSPFPVADKECNISPDCEETGIQCHRVPEMIPQPIVVDCLFPEEGWRSVDEILQPDEAVGELLSKAADQLHVPVDELQFVFQVGILFSLPETIGQAIQVMRGSSRQYIDEHGRETKEDERISQTLTPLYIDDLPSVHKIGKPVVTVWRQTTFMELDADGQLQQLDNGIMALEDKKYCAFYRALRVIGNEKISDPSEENSSVDGIDSESRTTVERLFLRVTALVYVDARTGTVFADEEKALLSCDANMDSESIISNFIVVLASENSSMPFYNLPKNRYLALFTRQDEDLDLTARGQLQRKSGASHSRMWILPKEVSKLMRDLTRYYTSISRDGME